MQYFGLLGDEDVKLKSKVLLTEAKENARKLSEKYATDKDDYTQDVSHCWCQLINWYALFEPEGCEEKYQEAGNDFKSLKIPQENPSWHFLTRIRYLGAWRAFELDERKPEEIETWPIPESSPDNEWLTALIYKYRAAIRRKLGQEREAIQDIIEASDLLSYSNASFQNMLRATVFIEKYKLTKEEADKSEALQCLEFLEKLGYLKDHREIAPSAWRSLLDGSLKGKIRDSSSLY